MYFNTGNLLARDHEVGWFAGADPDDEPSEDAQFFPSAKSMRRERMTDLPRYLHNRSARNALESMLDARGTFDVAHLHIYYGRLTAAIFGPLKARNIPIVQSLHDYKLACPIHSLARDGQICEDCISGSTLNLIRNRCKGTLGRSAVILAEYYASRLQGDVANIDRFICVSEFQRRMLARSGIPEGKMVTLHNFVDPQQLQPKGKIERENYFLYFGRIEKLKGLPTLIDAVRRTGSPLRIAGTGAWSEEMRAEIADMPNVEYLGFTSGEPLRRLVAQARAVVVPSECYDICPMSVLEAKAVGTPVVGARIGGIPELVRDGEDGFLFDPGDVEDLCRALEDMRGADTEGMANSARSDVNERFSPDVHLAALLDIYMGVGVGSI